MKFIVEGRSFTSRSHALIFAKHQAKLMDRSVEVKAEIEIDQPIRVERNWIATMHPPGTKVVTAIKQPLKRVARAAGE